MKKKGVPTDASSFIHLAKTGALATAGRALGALIVPPAVWREAVDAGEQRGAREVGDMIAAARQGWIHKVELDARARRRAAGIARDHKLGAGESEVLAIGAAYEFVLLDELRGAHRARALGVISIPCLLVPLLGADRGVLDEDQAVTLLYDLARHSNPRVEEIWRVERDIRRLFP